MGRRGIFALLCAGPLLYGCSDTVVLRDGPDGLALSYRCDAVQAQAQSSAERALVRVHSVELLRTVDPTGETSTSALVAAYDSGDWDRFERLVIERLCADRGAIERVAAGFATPRVAQLKRGEAAPGFTLPVLSRALLDGSPDSLSLSELRGRYVVLTFWSTWCVPCEVEYPELVALERQLGDRGVTVIGVLHRDSPDRALDYTEGLEAGAFTTVVDDGGALARAYQLYGIPLTAVIDPEGTLRDFSLGWSEGKGEELRTWFEGLLPRVG